jgi:hypothetical protein
MKQFSKALLHTRLKERGFVLKRSHWVELDKLLKKTGYITPEAVMVKAHGWGWNKPMLEEFKKALYWGLAKSGKSD